MYTNYSVFLFCTCRCRDTHRYALRGCRRRGWRRGSERSRPIPAQDPTRVTSQRSRLTHSPGSVRDKRVFYFHFILFYNSVVMSIKS